MASDRVRAYCQRIVQDGPREDFNYDATNPFRNMSGRALPQPVIWENSWGPSCFIPDRLTDSFTGRFEELSELRDWLNDVESRSCLVYGDGGLGKTTLLIEFLHRLLDEEIEVEWKPKLVLFYTAKRWQWGLSGLEPIGSGTPHLMELIAHLHVLVFAKFPPPEFYKFEVNQAATYLQNRIKNEIGLSRNDVLLVIDNAETLIQSEEDRNILGKELREVAKRLGRVALTSRRREIIEAAPIGIEPLAVREAVDFLRDRGRKLNLKILTKAADADLEVAVGSLERRPIVLEALVNALADPGIKKIEDAVSRVAGMLQRDLGEFLFADAWARLKPEVRRLLLLMTRVGDVHDTQSLRICCNILDVSPLTAEQALEESGGIATLVRVEGGIQISFSRNFLEFANGRIAAAGSIKPSDGDVAAARAQYSAFIQHAQRFTGDRIVHAFRTPQARAAHRARQQGRFEDSRKLYEQAVLTDSTNGWLFDRYAYFLFHDFHDNDAALHKAKRAVELLPEEGEVWYTRGLIEARLGDIRACEISLAKAEELGIDTKRCSMQRCWSYLKSRPAQVALAERELQRLKGLLKDASTGSKEWTEVERLATRIDYLRSRRR